MSGFGSGLKNSARVTWAARNTSGRSLIPLSTRSTSLMTGSYSISTSRMMPKRSPVRKYWVRVPWTMLHHTVRTRIRFSMRKGSGTFFVYGKSYGESTQNGKQEQVKAGYHCGGGILPFVRYHLRNLFLHFFSFMQNPPVHPGRCRNGQGDSDLLSGCVKSGRGAQRRCTGRLCSHRRSHRRAAALASGPPLPRATLYHNHRGSWSSDKGGICRKTTAEVGTVAQRRAGPARSCKICGAGLTNGSGRGKVMGGKGQSAFLRQKNEVVVMEPAGSSGSLYPRSKNQTAAFLHAGERPGCA